MTEAEAIDLVKSYDPGRTLRVRIFGDGTYAAVKRLIYHYTIIYGAVEDDSGYDNRWCYDDNPHNAIAALDSWNYPEQPEPTGWHRNPLTGRRRTDGDPSKEYIDY